MHTHKIRVYIEEIDGFGVVYHAKYLYYLERSRTEMLREYGLQLSELKKQDTLFAVSRLDIKYVYPAYLDDELLIESSLLKIKPCELVLNQTIKNQKGQLICKSTVYVVAITNLFKPKLIPKEIKEVIQNILTKQNEGPYAGDHQHNRDEITVCD